MGLMSIVSVEVEDAVREEATAILAKRGLTVADAVRIVLEQVAVDQNFTNGLVSAREERRHASAKTWTDFFDAPGIDFPDREQPVESVREPF
ncbi:MULTISPECIES: type II toxin-antitoxin system RelB/DinJ family antitoxin [unclassified Aureimonas]|uniref:type II toxin-antitoxin system RelB/DinJ family antitoxin n=1 Tax=unclassified Aureimonas TaxID=2615206 RepID=UPI0007006966|nr:MULTISPECIES: type II toxin-antitoxin system RelB/DinJ family antitoxin [unclassified Aureimonas]KQT53962.1 hypothetical protein ASG62_12095 [Aureimonas sp. Leaf427]KQT71598.1 hypothetical protein ASG54_19065 [Aureimonas sp. Leaf460]